MHASLKTPRSRLLVLPGWDDDSKEQFDQLRAALSAHDWECARADLPDASWSERDRDSATRGENLAQALVDYDALFAGKNNASIALLGFSYGGYMAALSLIDRPVDLLVLRSPALYPNDNWEVPKAELDKRKLASYRSDVHTPGENLALDGCFGFKGDVLLIDSEHDRIIPHEVIESYERALVNAASLTRYTIRGADHPLTDTRWRDEYHRVAVDWLINAASGRNSSQAEPQKD